MDVIFEDDYVLVVNKPSGIAVQTAGVGAKSIETECKKYRKQKGESPQIYIVHRLDQPVSGVLLLAKTKEAAAKLSKDIQDDAFTKDYKATVYKEKIIPKKGSLVDYIVKDGNAAKIVPSSNKDSKKAVLDYEIINETDNTYELLVHLKTGRFHQIRVQLSHLGVPILGDTKYGTDVSIFYSKEQNIKGVMLKAYHLVFKHPKTGEIMEYEI